MPPPQVVFFLQMGYRVTVGLSRLTLEERRAVQKVLSGKGNLEIARELGKSVGTVKNQLSSAYRKLGVDSRSRLMARFFSKNLAL